MGKITNAFAAFLAGFIALVAIERSAAACANSLTDCTSALPVCGAVVSGVCGPCSSDTDCSGRGALHVCALAGPSAGACIGCIQDGDCSQTLPHCDGNASAPGACTACVDDTNCTGYPAALACQSNDGITSSPGTCKQCSKTNSTACTGATPACNDINGACQLCTVPIGGGDAGANSIGCADAGEGTACQGSGATVFCGCSSNGDCSAATTAGSTCNGITNECRACAVDAGECPTNTACATTGTSAGHCVACVDDSTCTKPTVCDPAKNTCVGCLMNADCNNPTPKCASEICVACASDSDCAGNASGHVCARSGSMLGQCVQPTIISDAGISDSGASGFDASAAFDASTGSDAGADASFGDDGETEGGGCGCSTDDHLSGATWTGSAIAFVALGLTRRRRKRSR